MRELILKARVFRRDIAIWLEHVRRNVVTTMSCCHHFGKLMRARRKGGLLLVNSGACYGGASFMAAIPPPRRSHSTWVKRSGRKLRPHGVEVLNWFSGDRYTCIPCASSPKRACPFNWLSSRTTSRKPAWTDFLTVRYTTGPGGRRGGLRAQLGEYPPLTHPGNRRGNQNKSTGIEAHWFSFRDLARGPGVSDAHR